MGLPAKYELEHARSGRTCSSRRWRPSAPGAASIKTLLTDAAYGPGRIAVRDGMPQPRLSAFVISYKRASILATCRRALAFADELIVVDKSSTDGACAIAEAYADTLVTVPWTPTVEETRTLALSLCRHEWILFMDDDECLSPGADQWIRTELANPRAEIYAFPRRDYILGQHSERAYYWPEHHVRLFRRGAVTFSRTVHAGIICHSKRLVTLSPDDRV